MTSIAAAPTRIAILTQQVSHYHAARYRAARREFSDVRVVSAMNSADFVQFLSADAGSEVIRLYEGQSAYAKAARSGELWGRLSGALDALAPQVVAVAGWSFPESLAAIAWARDAGARVVVMSESQPHDAPRQAWREAIKRRVVSACDSALVAAAPHRDYVVRLGVAIERVFFGYDAVDNDHFAHGADLVRSAPMEARARFGLPERYLMASGRFIPKKNFPRLVEGFAQALGNDDRGHDLVILGDGPERHDVEAAARRLGIEHRIKLPGFLGYEDLPILYGLAEAFVHVPTSEQWGLVVNEAAAAGIPLVVSRPCGAAALLIEEGVNGALVNPLDTSDIERGLASVMHLPAEKRKAMGLASRRLVSQWGTDRFASGLRLASEAAMKCRPRRLSLFDRALFRLLSRIQIDQVS